MFISRSTLSKIVIPGPWLYKYGLYSLVPLRTGQSAVGWGSDDEVQWQHGRGREHGQSNIHVGSADCYM